MAQKIGNWGGRRHDQGHQRYTADFQPFIEQLSAVINDRNIPTAVVIAMREDFALELNAFHPFIPQLFENHYRLQRLTKSNARDAIEAPVKRIDFRYEPELVDRLLRDLTWSEQSDFLQTVALNPALVDMVDPVALQIVCSQLWDIEKTGVDKVFNLKTYEDKGGAEAFFRSYLNNIFTDAPPEKKYLAYRVFNHIVTRRGTKVAFTLNSLANTLPDADKQLLQELIVDLQKNLVLRYQWRKEEMWHEIYHDRFVDAIEKWSDSYKQERTKEISGFFEDFCATITTFSVKERKLAALALERFTGGSRAQEGYSSKELAEEINEDREAVAKILEPLEKMHILRKTSRDDMFVLYDDLFSGFIKQWLLNYYIERRNRKRRIRNIFIISAVSCGMIFPIIYDSFVNIRKHFFYLSVNEDEFDNVELYRGKPNSLDIFNLQRYIYETDYRRVQINPVMMFKEKLVNNYRQLNSELVDHLQPVERVEAYWRDGRTDKVFDSIQKVIQDYPERKQDIIEKLPSFHSLETIVKLAEYLRDDSVYKELHEKIVSVMALLPTPRVVDILLAVIDDRKRPPRVRQAAVEALESISRADFSVGYANKIKSSLIQLLHEQPHEYFPTDEQASFRLAVVQTLGRLGDKDALRQLRLLAQNRSSQIQRGASEILAGIRDADFIGPLLRQVESNRSNTFIQGAIIRAIGQVGDPEVVKTFIQLLQDESVNIRRSAAEALGHTGDPGAAQPLISRLNGIASPKEDEPGVRQSIIGALGRLGNSDTIEPVLTQLLLGEDTPSIMRIVVQALERLGAAKTLQTLIEKLGKEGDTRPQIIDALVLQRGFEMWCNTARQPCVGGGQYERPDRDRAKDGFGNPRY